MESAQWDELASQNQDPQERLMGGLQDYLHTGAVEDVKNASVGAASASRPYPQPEPPNPHPGSHMPPVAVSATQYPKTLESGAPCAPIPLEQVIDPQKDERDQPFVQEMRAQSYSPSIDPTRVTPEATTRFSTGDPTLDYTTTPSGDPMVWYLDETASISPFATRLQKLARRPLPFIALQTIDQLSLEHENAGNGKRPETRNAVDQDPVLDTTQRMSQSSAGVLTNTEDRFLSRGVQSTNTSDGASYTLSNVSRSLFHEDTIERSAVSSQIAGPSSELSVPPPPIAVSMGSSSDKDLFPVNPLPADHVATQHTAIISQCWPAQDTTHATQRTSPKPLLSPALSPQLNELQLLPPITGSQPIISNDADVSEHFDNLSLQQWQDQQHSFKHEQPITHSNRSDLLQPEVQNLVDNGPGPPNQPDPLPSSHRSEATAWTEYMGSYGQDHFAQLAR